MTVLRETGIHTKSPRGERVLAIMLDRIRSDVLRELLQYCDEKRGDRRAPSRDDIDSAGMIEAHPGMFLIDVAAAPRRYRGVGSDITEVSQEEEQFREELVRLVEARTAELLAAQEELMRKSRLATLGRLTSTVSHELRNPLCAIRNSIWVIKKIAGDEATTIRQAVDIADRSAARCDEIISELLEHSRVRPLHLSEVGLDEWLAGVLAELELSDGVELVRNFACDQALPVDPDRLRRVVLNVIDNAVQAMTAEDEDAPESSEKPTPRLTVSTRVTDSRVEFRVADNGPGMYQETLQKIFEPLYSTKAFGVGLGLTVVKQIMEQHGGGAEFESTPGEGTEVVLWLPLPEPARQAAS